jgi:hypothetical protein
VSVSRHLSARRAPLVGRAPMKFGKRAESSFNELHATGLVPFPYKSFKKMIKLLSHERPNATCPADVDVRESFLARLTDEARDVDAKWAVAAHYVVLASRSPGTMANYLEERGMGWCGDTGAAARKLEIWAHLSTTCVDKILMKYNQRCGDRHGRCEALPGRYCFSSGETIQRIEGLARK